MVLIVQCMNRLFWLAMLACLMVGCGSDGPTKVKVKGLVTYKGKAMEKIAVVFTPTGTGMMATGLTNEKGEFTLQTNEPGDGAIVGEYKVSFKYDSGVIPDMFNPKKEISPIPEKYGDAGKSGKTASVKADAAQNDFKFELE